MKPLCLTLILMLPFAGNAGWGPDTKLSTNEVAAVLNENMGQCIAANGTAVHVVWSDMGINSGTVFYKRSPDGGITWGADTRLPGDAGHDCNALLAVSGSNVHVVFIRNAGTPQAASYYKRSTDGGATWGPDVLLGNTKWWPGVAAAGDMVYVSLNTMVDATNSEVFFRRSTDNGKTWEPQQQISNAPGRSEDPAIAAAGDNVYLVWNDNRDTPEDPATHHRKGMAVYYRRSLDKGVTWGPETALTHAPDFTYFPAISLSGSNVDIAYGDRQTEHYDIYHLHSTDYGTTWAPKEQITHSPTDVFYPMVVRDGLNVNLTWSSPAGLMYQHSGNGGASWEPAVVLTSKGSFAFMATAGDVMHLIFRSQRDGHGAIYYKRNPSGN